ncbi:hypothetical protein BU24DRAFT_423880 [Aaosphaeria arxii CBS 175.79]|uniref:Uncharacterized protein n=1 Tax=Aaosphaeria arxii CBS 175.79 TaxID=1450172 RepID=A0A6A5XQF1_9PLEO|nr:uncharacterized protein BU24DRAFT_423880 [Aaosphaeria arxii CBS 175.79]KAF2014960.1 hypothetical protein BU24DRAFT_423880 [Aaosphaeria arxii CBS 175.79]
MRRQTIRRPDQPGARRQRNAPEEPMQQRERYNGKGRSGREKVTGAFEAVGR